LSVTRFAMYAPVVVLLSAPNMTPSLKLMAMLCGGQRASLGGVEMAVEGGSYMEVPRL
jgi:hypothetical protein